MDKSQDAKILAAFDEHASHWRTFLANCYGEQVSSEILKEAREQTKRLIPQIPYIGGDANPMTHHLIRSAPSLALYQVMKSHGKTAADTGKIIYDAVVETIRQLPFSPSKPPSADFIQRKKEDAKKSQQRRYPGDWVWEFVERREGAFDYGYDFFECGVQKYYQAQDASEFLPYFCFLDFVTARASGQELIRTMTLAEGREKCDFRLRSVRGNQGWPPPFPGEPAAISSSYVEDNARSRERLRQLLKELTDEELGIQIVEGWTVSAILAHLAFWDQRVLVLIERWKTGGAGPSPIDIDGVNDAMQPICLAIPAREAVNLAIHAAEVLDAELENLPENLEPAINLLVQQGKFRLDRSIHRNEHLDQIEVALAASRRKDKR